MVQGKGEPQAWNSSSHGAGRAMSRTKAKATITQVLCCAVLCCAVLCYAMLCYAMMCHDVPCCAMLCRPNAVLCCAVLCCAVLCRAAVCMLFSCCHHDCRLPVWCVHDHSDIVAPAKLALTSSDCCCLMTCRSSSRTAWRALYATQMLVS